MSITLHLGSDLHDFSIDPGAGMYSFGGPSGSSRLALEQGDIHDGRPSDRTGPDKASHSQDPDDLMALMNFIALLMAILQQFLSQGGPGKDQSGEDGSVKRPPLSRSAAHAGGATPGEIDGGPATPVTPTARPPVSLAAVKDDPHSGDWPGNNPGQGPQDAPEKTSASPGAPSGSGKVVSTGTGSGHFFNVTNNTDREQTFAFSSNSSNTSGYSNHVNAVMTLKPGETGTFEAGDNVPGIRINTSGPNGETHGNEALFEDTIEQNPMGGGVVHNPDVSDVAGKLSYDGRPQRITVNDGTRSIGDGTETGVYDYDVEDTDPNRATNPMNMALDPASTYSIVFTDG